MTKRQFVQIAYEIGYNCKYSGKTKTFYITASKIEDDISGGLEFRDELLDELRHSDFNIIEQY